MFVQERRQEVGELATLAVLWSSVFQRITHLFMSPVVLIEAAAMCSLIFILAIEDATINQQLQCN